MPDHVFTEEEVKAIIRRASEEQAEDAERQEARRHGLTLDDLERLGAEVGLDPAYLRRAADEVRTGRRTAAETETQTDTHVIVERRIERPFMPEAWEDTVVMLRQSFGGASEGRIEQVGRAREWVHTSALGIETRVSASDRDGQTRVILSQRVGTASSKTEAIGLGAVLGLVLGVIGGIPVANALDSFGAFLLVWLVIMVATTLIASPFVRRWDERWRKKKQRGLKDLAADIEAIFEAAAPRSAGTATNSDAARAAEQEAAPGARLALDTLPDGAEDAPPPARNRVRS